MPSWSHLIRFQADDGEKYFSYFESKPDETLLTGKSVTGFSVFADLLKGESGRSVTIREILAPVPYNGDIICIGLNYSKHAEEAKLSVPLDPVMWYKPSRALRGPGNLKVPKTVANNFPDFEGELCIVTSKDALNVSVEDASKYILGFTAGNDLTARSYQDPKRGGNQFTRCKAFDGFAPVGPLLVNAQEFGDWSTRRIVTKVNGKVFQDSECDLIHGPAKLAQPCLLAR
ncbi:hypothetical protein CORC01_04604 [Colletotrichum orchidophilum]|uniref:Fumarylacetoacetase-like C-terminal domain-containing protein n=1 Tax=Colletotrichum orchidophilum TaxID=1209926 RepID=A0A1G4BFR7_9PEZI|nr:uncharacterized protein CORC01_04604 [Colletotrichum orchidophilum]OHF00196.1 hypothetical protein CORC01_04604 [Colletotrichum orchidophilum]